MTVRTTRPGDGDAVKRLIPMAMHGDEGPPNLANLPAAADQGLLEDRRGVFSLVSRRTGEAHESNALMSFRVAEHFGQPAGITYCGPPIYWTRERSGLPIRPMILVTERLMELQLLAVLPEYRHMGYGARLLSDVIHRYRTEGYTALMVVVSGRADRRLLPWYERHGFVFAPRGRPYKIQFWRYRPQHVADYTHIGDDQHLGMLPLAETVDIEPPTIYTDNMPVLTGLLD